MNLWNIGGTVYTTRARSLRVSPVVVSSAHPAVCVGIRGAASRCDGSPRDAPRRKSPASRRRKTMHVPARKGQRASHRRQRRLPASPARVHPLHSFGAGTPASCHLPRVTLAQSAERIVFAVLVLRLARFPSARSRPPIVASRPQTPSKRAPAQTLLFHLLHFLRRASRARVRRAPQTLGARPPPAAASRRPPPPTPPHLLRAGRGRGTKRRVHRWASGRVPARQGANEVPPVHLEPLPRLRHHELGVRFSMKPMVARVKNGHGTARSRGP